MNRTDLQIGIEQEAPQVETTPVCITTAAGRVDGIVAVDASCPDQRTFRGNDGAAIASGDVLSWTYGSCATARVCFQLEADAVDFTGSVTGQTNNTSAPFALPLTGPVDGLEALITPVANTVWGQTIGGGVNVQGLFTRPSAVYRVDFNIADLCRLGTVEYVQLDLWDVDFTFFNNQPDTFRTSVPITEAHPLLTVSADGLSVSGSAAADSQAVWIRFAGTTTAVTVTTTSTNAGHYLTGATVRVRPIEYYEGVKDSKAPCAPYRYYGEDCTELTDADKIKLLCRCKCGTTAATAEAQPDSEFLVLCDTAANGRITKFLRRFTTTGTTVAVTNTTADGVTAYTPTGTVGVCSGNSFDTEADCYITTASSVPVPVWVRHDDSLLGQTGPHISAAGFAVFDRTTGAPVNISQAGFQLGQCQTCCPIQMGTGCWVNGTQSGNWVSLRETDGTIRLLDVVTGNAVAAANVVACSTAKREVTQLSSPNAAVFAIPSASDLTSWTVMHVSGTVTVRVNTGPEITLLVGESLHSDAQDDGILDDAVSINAQSGQARVLWTQLVI